jgi:hypothetical protein
VVSSSLRAFCVDPNFEPVGKLDIRVDDHALVKSLLTAIRLFSRVELLLFNALLLKEVRFVVLRVFKLLRTKNNGSGSQTVLWETIRFSVADNFFCGPVLDKSLLTYLLMS